MNEEAQRTVAVWTVLVLSFAFLCGFLYVRSQLTVEVIVLYWFPPVVLTITGVFPVPWKPFVEEDGLRTG